MPKQNKQVKLILNGEDCFYGALSACGVAVSAFTLYEEWRNSWLEIFDALWSRVFGSVIVIWFLFQIGESVMGAYQSYLDYRAARLRAAEEWPAFPAMSSEVLGKATSDAVLPPALKIWKRR